MFEADNTQQTDRRTKLNTKMQNSKMGIPLVLFGKEREIGFDHLVPRPGNNSEQLTRVVFFKGTVHGKRGQTGHLSTSFGWSCRRCQNIAVGLNTCFRTKNTNELWT